MGHKENELVLKYVYNRYNQTQAWIYVEMLSWFMNIQYCDCIVHSNKISYQGLAKLSSDDYAIGLWDTFVKNYTIIAYFMG